MSFTKEKALVNVESYINDICFIDKSEKRKIDEIIRVIVNEIEGKSINGHINYEILIKTFYVSRIEHLKYINYELYQKGFYSEISENGENYIFNIKLI